MSAPFHLAEVRRLRAEALLLLLAIGGGGVFSLLAVPAAWLSGAMVAVALASLSRPLPALRRPWFDLAMLLSGTLIGSAATPEALAGALHYPGSILLLFLGMAAIMFATGAYLRLVGGWPWIEALLAAAPGALQAVVAIAKEKNVEIGRIAVVQVMRLIILVALLPGVMGLAAAPSAPHGAGAPILGAAPAGLLMLCCLAGGWLFERLGVVSAMILGATTVSAVAHATGLVAGTLPADLQRAALVLLGAITGTRIAAIPRAQLFALLPLAAGAFLVSMAVALLFAWPAARLAGVPYAAGIAAFAPGAIDTMAMLAFVLGFDPIYVGAHHLIRFFALGFALPLLIGWLKPGR